jgi:hypothetical protein
MRQKCKLAFSEAQSLYQNMHADEKMQATAKIVSELNNCKQCQKVVVA